MSSKTGSHSKLTSCGAVFYIVGVAQFVVCIAIAGSRYGPPAYSPVTVTLSDLQAVRCGTFQGAYVCSPLHDLANLSVAVLGLLIIAGSLSLRPRLSAVGRRDIATGLLVVAGVAAFANAFAPEDVTFTGDIATAIVAFLAANFGLIQVGSTTPAEPRWRGYRQFSQALGTTGIAALTLDGFGLGTVIGGGAIEWLIVAPILVWAPVTGFLLIIEVTQAARRRSWSG